MSPSPIAGTSGPLLPSLRVSMFSSVVDLAQPVPGAQKVAVEPGFVARGIGFPVVAPGHSGRQRHEYRFRAAARLQSEQGAAIIDEIEFDIAAAPVGLEVPLALAVGDAPAALHDGQVRRQKMIAHALQQPEAALEAAVVEVVEEYAA